MKFYLEHQNSFFLAFILSSILLLQGCGHFQKDAQDSLFKLLNAEHTGIKFTNEVEESVDLNIVTFEMLYNGAGVGVGDVNNDGLVDIFFASNMGNSKLYLNEGSFQFSDITAQAGINTEGKWANGVTIVDINNDGYLDIYISCGGPYANPSRRANELYINNGDLTFTERAEDYGIADTGFTTHAAFFDYNKNGFLDLYLLTNAQGETPPNVIRKKQVKGEHLNTDRLYRNNGNGSFTNVSDEAGILIEGYGLGINVFDINEDGWPDIHIANDFLSNDVIYKNNKDGTFSDRAGEYFRHQSYASMGTDFGDINNDGLMDIITVDMLPDQNERLKKMYESAGYDRFHSELGAGYDPQFKRNVLQLNNGLTPEGQPLFTDISLLAGVHSTDWSWTALFADFNNNSWLDLLVTNGLPRNPADNDFSKYKMELLRSASFDQKAKQKLFSALQKLEGVYETNFLFRNNGDLTFTDKSEEWGFNKRSFSTGAVYADLNNNGYLDLVMNNTNDQAFVYQNTAVDVQGNFLKVKLNGPDKNKQGIGTHITIYSEGKSQHHQYSVSRGYLSSMATPVHFGLGSKTKIDSLVIKWPDKTKHTVTELSANQLVEVSYNAEKDSNMDWVSEREPRSEVRQLFKDVTKERNIQFSHKEQDYIDFKNQPLLPHQFSRTGPGIAVGDINGSGMDDFFVGGAFEQSGKIFIQNEDGTFDGHNLDTGPNYEKDMGALFLDVNGDGNKDLFVASGGSEFQTGSEYYQDRLYLGDGNGGFKLQPNALPQMRSSSSIVTAADFDKDGSKELFVGARVLPNMYPVAPESYILKYQNDQFIDITDQVASSLREIGMVTSAVWSDFNNDSWVDLIIVGEWMPITVFENINGELVNVTEELGLSETVGWWNSITAGDFDQNGFPDYVVGNLGLNSTLKNNENGSVKIHFDDFNDDGIIDPVISRMINNKRYPVHLRDDFVTQIPEMKRKFPTYESYGQATLSEVFSNQQLENARSHTIDTFQTSLLENINGQSFEVRPLPIEAQFAPVFGMLSGDFDGDNYPDLLMIGNSFSTEVFTGWYDAFSGLYLKGNGDGNFEPLNYRESGFFFNRDGKALAEIAGSQNEQLILAAHNNGPLKVFQTRERNNFERIFANDNEVWAEIYYKNGSIEKKEFYDGRGYLSQSSKSILVNNNIDEVIFYDAFGNSRKVVPESE